MSRGNGEKFGARIFREDTPREGKTKHGTRACVRVYMEVTGDRTSGFTGSLTRRSGCYVVDENRRDIYSTYAYKYVLRACTYVLVVCLFVREGSCVASANSLDRRDVCASLLSFSFLFSSFIFALPFPPFYFLFRFSFPFFPPRFTFPRTNERTNGNISVACLLPVWAIELGTHCRGGAGARIMGTHTPEHVCLTSCGGPEVSIVLWRTVV